MRRATIIQVHGIGPFRSTLADSVYELGSTGVIARLSLLEPPAGGTVTTTVPAACFPIKLGARVRASLGEGEVGGAQCSPANDRIRIRRRLGR